MRKRVQMLKSITIFRFMTTFQNVAPKIETGWATGAVKPIWKLEMLMINVKA